MGTHQGIETARKRRWRNGRGEGARCYLGATGVLPRGFAKVKSAFVSGMKWGLLRAWRPGEVVGSRRRVRGVVEEQLGQAALHRELRARVSTWPPLRLA